MQTVNETCISRWKAHVDRRCFVCFLLNSGREGGMEAVSFFPREEQGVAAFPSMVDAVRVLPEVTDIFTPSLEEWRKQFFLFFLKIFLY